MAAVDEQFGTLTNRRIRGLHRDRIRRERVEFLGYEGDAPRGEHPDGFGVMHSAPSLRARYHHHIGKHGAR